MEGSSSTRSYSTIAIGAFVVGAVSQYLIQRLVASWKQKNGEPNAAGGGKETTTTPPLSKAEAIELRKAHFSSANSVSYANTGPLMIVKGRGARLIDEKGVSFLDTRNNVAHCGHCHPRVARAIQQQQGTLNTNTRYLHPTTCALAKCLTDKLPAPLDTVFFVNSGSEANDLALRLAKVWSGGSSNTIVVENAYHGHTQATLDVSSCKFSKSKEYALESKNKNGLPSTPGPHIYQVPCPDMYRGKYSGEENAGAMYAKHVLDACNEYTQRGEKVRAFLFESGVSVGGAILPPKGYLPAAAEAVRRIGGLYIADEVQTGFGRLGECYWAFQYHDKDLVPDIVTVGKAFGNGTPLAAVITSKEIAQAFESCKVEYFNTFGGNPVSTTAGLAVMNVIEDEGLQQNALETGAYLKSRFLQLQQTIDLIGDVRGVGFFLGVEFVKDRKTKEPAALETAWLCSQLKERYHILTSIDGPLENILNFKPPMVFSRADVDFLMSAVEKALTHDIKKVDFSKVTLTPT